MRAAALDVKQEDIARREKEIESSSIETERRMEELKALKEDIALDLQSLRDQKTNVGDLEVVIDELKMSCTSRK